MERGAQALVLVGLHGPRYHASACRRGEAVVLARTGCHHSGWDRVPSLASGPTGSLRGRERWFSSCLCREAECVPEGIPYQTRWQEVHTQRAVLRATQGGVLRGGIRKSGPLPQRASLSGVPESVCHRTCHLFLRMFMVWLTMLLWKRDSDTAAGVGPPSNNAMKLTRGSWRLRSRR